jgi:hypothetical protein
MIKVPCYTLCEVEGGVYFHSTEIFPRFRSRHALLHADSRMNLPIHPHSIAASWYSKAEYCSADVVRGGIGAHL